MSNLCVREEVEIDWWIVDGKGSIGGGLDAECQRRGSMDRRMMGMEDPEEALRIITDEENNRSEEQNRQITVNADIVQHTYTVLFFSSAPLF